MLGVIFYSVSFRLFNLAFLTEFSILSERFCCPGLKLKKSLPVMIFSLNLRGLKIVNLANMG